METQIPLVLVPTPSGRLLRHKRNKRYGSGVAIWQIKASRRSIKSGRSRYFLSFPNVVFRFEYRDKYEARDGSKDNLLLRKVSCAFITADSPRSSTKVYSPPLGNVDSGLRVCISGIPIYAKTVEELCRKAVADFWNSRFNFDITDALEDYQYERENKRLSLSSYKKWHKRTEAEPNWTPGCKDMVEWADFGQFCKMDTDSNYDRSDYDDYDYEEEY